MRARPNRVKCHSSISTERKKETTQGERRTVKKHNNYSNSNNKKKKKNVTQALFAERYAGIRLCLQRKKKKSDNSSWIPGVVSIPSWRMLAR
jgi:hypothetical protein